MLKIFKNPSKEELFSEKEWKGFLGEKDWWIFSENIRHSLMGFNNSELDNALAIFIIVEKEWVRIVESGENSKFSSGEVEFIKTHPFVNSLKSFGVKELRIGQEDILL